MYWSQGEKHAIYLSYGTISQTPVTSVADLFLAQQN